MLSATKYYNTLEPHQLLLDRKQDSSILIYLLEKLQITKNGKKKMNVVAGTVSHPLHLSIMIMR